MMEFLKVGIYTNVAIISTSKLLYKNFYLEASTGLKISGVFFGNKWGMGLTSGSQN